MMYTLSGMNDAEQTKIAAKERVCFDFDCRPTVFYTTKLSCDYARFWGQVTFQFY